MCCPKNTHAQHKTKPKVSASVFKSRVGLTPPLLERKRGRIKSVDIWAANNLKSSLLVFFFVHTHTHIKAMLWASRWLALRRYYIHVWKRTATTPCYWTAWGHVKGLLAPTNMLLFYKSNSTSDAVPPSKKQKKSPISVHVLRHLVTLEAFFFSNKSLKLPKLHLVLYHLNSSIKKVTFSLKRAGCSF